MLQYLIGAIIGAIAALAIYIVARKLLLKGQKEAILRAAEAEGEQIKRKGSCRPRRNISSSRPSTSSM